MLIWERSREVYYASVTEPLGDVRLCLIIEGGGDRWDWTVWRPGETPPAARYGVTATVQEAMREAEQAAA
jgi:hypothetical protein